MGRAKDVARKILLTGGSGLVGRTLVPLLEGRYAVQHFDRVDPGDGHSCVIGDLCDAEAVTNACRGMDAIIHVAALHGRAWAEAGDEAGFRVNVLGTMNILEGARLAGARRVVYTSSIWATGHGANPPYLPIDEDLPREAAELYGLTKTLGEGMCRYITANGGPSTICLRPGGILPADASAAQRVGLLGASVDVRDVAQAHLLALEAPDGLRHGVFCITAESPLCCLAPDAWRADPVGSLDRIVPGVAAATAAGRLSLPVVHEWYSIARARRVLGYAPRHNYDLTLYGEG